MADAVLVSTGDTELYVQVVSDPLDQVEPVGLGDVYSLDGLTDAIEAVAGAVASSWRKVRPSEAEAEFGLSVTAKAGKLVGMLVDGSGEATVKVTLRWKGATPDEPPA